MWIPFIFTRRLTLLLIDRYKSMSIRLTNRSSRLTRVPLVRMHFKRKIGFDNNGNLTLTKLWLIFSVHMAVLYAVLVAF